MSTATPRQLWLVSATLAVLFVAFQIQSSFHSGALSLPVTYDDVGYFNDALTRLEVLYRNGGKAFLLVFLTNPPHAPLSTLLAVMGFGLFGPHQWAADAMNALPLLLLVRLFLGFACRTLSLTRASILAGALLAFPALGLLILEFRPDAMCALFTAAGALVIAADPDWRAGSRRAHAMAAAFFVGAMLAKPTLAPVTVAVFGVAIVAVIVLQAASKADAWRIAKTAAISGGIGVLLVLPYYVASFQHLYEYITVNAFGKDAGIWAKNGLTDNPAAYYFTGPGGNAAIGSPWLALCGILLVVSAPLWIRRWRIAASVFAAALMAYISVTVVGMKSPFIGLVVPAFVLGVSAILSTMLLGRLGARSGAVAALVLLAFSVLTWRPVSMRLFGAPVPAVQAQQFTRIYTQVADAVATIPDLSNRRLYFPVIAQYLNQDNLEFEMRRRGLGAPAVEPAIYLVEDIAKHREAIARADIVVLFTDDSTLPLPWPGSVTIRKEITKAVDQAGLVTVGTVEAGPYLGAVRVLVRR